MIRNVINFEDWRRQVYLYAISIVKDEFVADDLTQDVFLKMLSRHSSYLNNKTSIYFTLKVANRICLDYFRNPKRKRFLYDANMDVSFNLIHDDFSENERHKNDEELLSGLISKLPNKNKEVVLMKLTGMTHKEIAKEMNLCVDAVLDRSNRAKVLFKKMVS